MSMAVSLRLRRHAVAALAAIFLCPASLLVTGCGSGGTTTSPGGPTVALVISAPPVDQTIPLGSAGIFSVTATGDGTLTYQWYRDGVAIPNATASTFVTGAVQTGDDGALYTVAVSDKNSTLTSSQAKLTIGVRSPQVGDLRFQQVGSGNWTSTYLLHSNFNVGISGNSSSYWQTGVVGTPLELAPPTYNCSSTICSWFFEIVKEAPAAPFLGMNYIGDKLTSFDVDLAQIPPANVVTSMDMPAGTGVFAVAITEGTSSQPFDVQHETVTAAALSATVAADAAKSRVVTAVSFDQNGMAHVLSYGWAGDTATVYDTSVTVGSGSTLEASANSLASQGYIITAFGGSPASGYILVGTKVHGDTLARPIWVSNLTHSNPAPSGAAIIGFLQYSTTSNPEIPDSLFLAYEK